MEMPPRCQGLRLISSPPAPVLEGSGGSECQRRGGHAWRSAVTSRVKTLQKYQRHRKQGFAKSVTKNDADGAASAPPNCSSQAHLAESLLASSSAAAAHWGGLNSRQPSRQPRKDKKWSFETRHLKSNIFRLEYESSAILAVGK